MRVRIMFYSSLSPYFKTMCGVVGSWWVSTEWVSQSRDCGRFLHSPSFKQSDQSPITSYIPKRTLYQTIQYFTPIKQRFNKSMTNYWASFLRQVGYNKYFMREWMSFNSNRAEFSQEAFSKCRSHIISSAFDGNYHSKE